MGGAHPTQIPVGGAHPKVMSEYRRYFVAGATYFFTIVAYKRRPIFADEISVQLLRESISAVKVEMPFDINAAVILEDHMHFIWSLPPGDDNYSKRIGLLKVEFTKRLQRSGLIEAGPSRSASRRKHRESDVWQRRFWERTIRDEDECEARNQSTMPTDRICTFIFLVVCISP